LRIRQIFPPLNPKNIANWARSLPGARCAPSRRRSGTGGRPLPLIRAGVTQALLDMRRLDLNDLVRASVHYYNLAEEAEEFGQPIRDPTSA
jgi:hypothetical protein